MRGRACGRSRTRPGPVGPGHGLCSRTSQMEDTPASSRTPARAPVSWFRVSPAPAQGEAWPGRLSPNAASAPCAPFLAFALLARPPLPFSSWRSPEPSSCVVGPGPTTHLPTQRGRGFGDSRWHSPFPTWGTWVRTRVCAGQAVSTGRGAAGSKFGQCRPEQSTGFQRSRPNCPGRFSQDWNR